MAAAAEGAAPAGYRPNAAAVVMDAEGRVLVGRRVREKTWQLPQGGIEEGEDVVAAARREAAEECGLPEEAMKLERATEKWYSYNFPGNEIKFGRFLGQKQRYVFFRLESSAAKAALHESDEFDAFEWIEPAEVVRRVHPIKKAVYADAFLELGLVSVEEARRARAEHDKAAAAAQGGEAASGTGNRDAPLPQASSAHAAPARKRFSLWRLVRAVCAASCRCALYSWLLLAAAVAFIAVTAIGKYPRAHWVLATVGYAHDLTLPLLGLPDDTSLEAVLRARSNFALEVRVLAEVSRVLQGEPPVFSHSVQIPAPEGRTIRARVYSHRSALNASAAPALIFFHGGGHVVCSMDDYDWIARRMANRLKSVRVISIDYRLAPEAPYPAAVHDAFNSTRYIIEHAAEFKINPKRVAVGGDSAGGNLATVVALLWREHKLAPQLAFQLLIYPATSLVLKKSASSQVHTVLLSEGMMRWFAHHYVGKSSRAALPTVSPLRAANLSGLPPAHFLLAKEDVLRMDAEEYAAKMQSAGVDVSITVAESMIHGFLFFDGIVPACTALLDEAASALLASI